jgi:hypothetical protein
MRIRLIIAFASAFLTASCTQAPPAEYRTPEFEEITIDSSDPAAVAFTCRMSSMSQLTEYGLEYTDEIDAADARWKRVAGTKTSGDSFVVILKDLAPGTTYCYRMYIGNGRDILKSAQNYYTTPEL